MYGQRRQELERRSACTHPARYSALASVAHTQFHGASAFYGYALQSEIDEQRRHKCGTRHALAQGLDVANDDPEGCWRVDGARTHRKDPAGHGRPYKRVMQPVPVHGRSCVRATETRRVSQQGDIRLSGVQDNRGGRASIAGLGSNGGQIEGCKNKMTRQNMDAACSESGLDPYRFCTRYPFPRSDSGLDKSAQSLAGHCRNPVLTCFILVHRFWTPLLLPTGKRI